MGESLIRSAACVCPKCNHTFNSFKEDGKG